MKVNRTPFRSFGKKPPKAFLLILYMILIAGTITGAGIRTEPAGESRIDTVFSVTLTPGAVHTRYKLEGPNILDIITVKLDAPHLHFETFRPDSLTRTTVQSLANDREGNRVVAAINGDFFSFETHWPIANQMAAGWVVHGVPVRNRHHFAVDIAGRPFLDAFSFDGRIETSHGTVFPVYSINQSARDRDGMDAPNSSNSSDETITADITAYNRYFGEAAPSGNALMEFTLVPGDHKPPVGAGIDHLMHVDAIYSRTGNSIPENGFLLQVHSQETADYLSRTLDVNSQVIFHPGFQPAHPGIMDVMGGGVRILDQGKPYSGTNELRHPRTFVAIDRDTSTVFLCTVDGRQMASIGMTYREMASILLQIGAWDAVNLDGGGSTTMVIRNKVANTPSDPSGERRVANSLQLISKAPPGEPESLKLRPASFDLYPHETKWLSASAYDEFQNPVPVPVPEDITWHADPSLGSLQVSAKQAGEAFFQNHSDSGTDISYHAHTHTSGSPGSYAVLIPGKTDTSGYVSVRYGQIADSVHVRIHHFTEMAALPDRLEMAPGEKREISLFGVTDDGSLTGTTDEPSLSGTTDEPSLSGTTDDGSLRRIPLNRVQIERPEELIHLSESGTAYARNHGEGSIRMDIGSSTLTIPFVIQGETVQNVLFDFSDGITGWAAPAQTHRSQIHGVNPQESLLNHTDDTATWIFVDDPDSGGDWDIRITRHSRQELGDLIIGDYAGALVYSDSELEMQILIRDGDGQLEAGPPVTLTPEKWQIIQTRLDDTFFEGYLNGNGKLTPERNQVNGFRIRMDKNDTLHPTATLKIRKILSSPSPLAYP